ncbi:MAG: zinc-dependent alcohol dehydrogenase family protein [Anaerolineae bacterium]|nr:zinc-dependent alcohol dehydrogenase family protein [Anaerolineae bacterium]MCI0609141.1 zinc-dependent alcohol dehydrogenase family protein [Anaerolineae bacterium]
MKAMLLREITPLAQNQTPLSFADIPEPKIGEGEVLLRVTRCGVCHTELDEIEGRTPPPHLPVVLGHQVVGTLESHSLLSGMQEHTLKGRPALQKGQRVGMAWIASACGKCNYCKSSRENLCAEFKATGRDINGGYAEYMKVRADFVHPIPDSISDSEAAPLLCAGAVGYRALKLCNLQDGQSLGLMGFGGSNHIVLKTAKHKFPNSPILVFSRNPSEREFAFSLGAVWAGAIDQSPPEGLDAIIDTTPVWGPVSEALKFLSPGGRLVINAIRKEESDKEVLLKLDYPSQLWMEKEIKSVANVTRADVREFLQLAAETNIKPEFQEYELKDANQALLEMKQGKIRGAKVLRIN